MKAEQQTESSTENTVKDCFIPKQNQEIMTVTGSILGIMMRQHSSSRGIRHQPEGAKHFSYSNTQRNYWAAWGGSYTPPFLENNMDQKYGLKKRAHYSVGCPVCRKWPLCCQSMQKRMKAGLMVCFQGFLLFLCYHPETQSTSQSSWDTVQRALTLTLTRALSFFLHCKTIVEKLLC